MPTLMLAGRNADGTDNCIRIWPTLRNGLGSPESR